MSFLARFMRMATASDRGASPAQQAYADGFHIFAGAAAMLASPWIAAIYAAGLVVVQILGRFDRDARLDILAGLAGIACAAAGGPLSIVAALAAWIVFARARDI